MRNDRRHARWFAAATLVLASLTACGGSDAEPGQDSAQASATGAPAVPGGPQTPDPGGKTITVEMLTDDQGNNIFRPAKLEARRGDVLRFTLVSGVHNVNFPADSNPGKSGLPPAGQMLQLPGQTHDMKVAIAPGSYYFHCDPHALLGMKGQLTVAP
jgi:plastocyanin